MPLYSAQRVSMSITPVLIDSSDRRAPSHRLHLHHEDAVCVAGANPAVFACATAPAPVVGVAGAGSVVVVSVAENYRLRVSNP